MTDEPTTPAGDVEAPATSGGPPELPVGDVGQEPAWARRRRLAEVFGDVLPEQTADDRPRGDGTPDSWLRDQVPPHHG